MDQPDLSADLAFAHELADAAAEVTLAGFGSRLPVELKDDTSPVTAVDRAAEGAIRRRVEERFPGDGVLGEESGLDEGSTGRLWIVDPIDGTRLYAEGIPLWTTLIALDVSGTSMLGVADAPALGTRYHATRGGGAWRQDRRLRVSATSRLEDAFVLHSPVEDWTHGDAEALLAIAGQARQTRGMSDAWGQLQVAQGSAEALLEHERCLRWDWAATRVVVEEAGGRLTTFTGDPVADGADLLVSNGAIHQQVLAALGNRPFAGER